MNNNISLHKGLFVAGTGTEVGKTLVCAALLSWLQKNSIDSTYLKAVSTDGVARGERFVSPDSIWIKDVCGFEIPAAELNPVCLGYPLSPLASARLENRELSWDEILRRVRNSIDERYGGWVICEGAGGVMVPLCSQRTILDLMVELGFPVLLVAKPELGTINHTLLSIQTMVCRGLDVIGFVFSGEQSGVSLKLPTATNSHLIEEFSGVSFLGQLPWMKSLDVNTMAHEVEEHFDSKFLSMF